MSDYMYRVRVLEYPDGALEAVEDGSPGNSRLTWITNLDWSPPGWKPSAEYVRMTGTTMFTWPKTETPYRCRSTAEKRAELLTAFGATVVIERTINRWLEVDPIRDGEVVSPYELDEEEWPVLDAPRTLADEDGDRVVLEEFGSVAPIAEDLERWCLLPLRLVRNEAEGLELEVGPYTLLTHAVDAITSALTSYYAALWALQAAAD